MSVKGEMTAFDFDLPGLVEWSGLGSRFWYGKIHEIDHYKIGKRLWFIKLSSGNLRRDRRLPHCASKVQFHAVGRLETVVE